MHWIWILPNVHPSNSTIRRSIPSGFFHPAVLRHFWTKVSLIFKFKVNYFIVFSTSGTTKIFYPVALCELTWCMALWGWMWAALCLSTAPSTPGMPLGESVLTTVTRLLFTSMVQFILKTAEQINKWMQFLGTAHCANMYPESQEDLPQLTAARHSITGLLAKWLQPSSKIGRFRPIWITLYKDATFELNNHLKIIS